MEKVIVIGCPGSGKTTLSGKLHEATRLPLFHLDAIWHRADKTHISRDEFDARLGEIIEQDSWIIDGNYSRTLERRIIACDTVVLFDLPTEVCLEGVSLRLGKERPDMPWVETEIDPWFKQEIEEFGENQMPEIYALLAKYKREKRIVILTSREEADEFIDSICSNM